MNLPFIRSRLLWIALVIFSSSVVNASPQPRIIGGVESAAEDWQFMTGLMFKSLGVKVNTESYNAAFMSGAPATLFSGALVDCQQGFSVCDNAVGRICLIERGTSFFYEKVANCESGGGVGAIIYNNEEGPFYGTLGNDGGDIPAVSIDRAYGLELFNYLNQEIEFGYTDQIPTSSFCGASYIGDKWLVTAAHCVDDVDAEAISVNIGGHDLAIDQENLFNVANIIIHSEYSFEPTLNDIALIELNTNPTGMPIVPLADESMLQAAINSAQNAITLGRGLQEPVEPNGPTGSAAPPVSALFEVKLPLLSNDACNSSLNRYGNAVTEDMVCAGTDEGGTGSCLGDSGGPLLIETQGQHYLVGITSWGIGCAQPELYDVYTRVPYFKTNIEAILNGEMDILSTKANTAPDTDPDDTTNISEEDWYSTWGVSTSLISIIIIFLARSNTIQRRITRKLRI